MKIFKNYIYNLIYQIISVLLPFFITPYISRVLGVQGVGRYSLINTIANYFIIIGMVGINVYGNRQISYTRDDPEKMEQTFWDLNALRYITMGIASLTYFIYLIWWVKNGDRPIYLAEFLLLLASLIDISWYFEGTEEFKILALRNILIKLIGVILIFLFVKKSEDLVVYAAILSGSTLIGQAFLWKEIKNKIHYRKVVWKNLKKHFICTLRLWVPTVSIKIYSTLDKLLLGILSTDAQVGLYTSSQNIVTMATTITSTLTVVTLPRMSNYYKNERFTELKKVSELSVEMVSMIAFPMTFGLIGISETLVPWFFGPGYEALSKLLLISAWFILTVSWSNIFGNQILLACGEEKKYTIAVGISAIENIILSIVLIYKMEAAGAIIASVLAEYTGMLIMFWNVKKIFDLSKMAKRVLFYALDAIIMLGIIYWIGKFFVKSFIATCVQIGIGIVIYFLILFIVRDRNFFLAISYVKNIFRNIFPQKG